ncbi:MAG: hypothetical protein O2780_06495 [Proteobacteria bacterium]|jgi:hypothetical protein|nr:hypothetical protein [Pseudomonadota bacterium]MDA1301881.1 hypothetical protein [Pseudomonadota bacterium]
MVYLGYTAQIPRVQISSVEANAKRGIDDQLVLMDRLNLVPKV